MGHLGVRFTGIVAAVRDQVGFDDAAQKRCATDFDHGCALNKMVVLYTLSCPAKSYVITGLISKCRHDQIDTRAR